MSASKILSIILFILLGVSAVFIILLYVGEEIEHVLPDGNTKLGPTHLKLNIALNWAKILILITASIAILAQIYHLIFISGNILKPLIVLVAFAILIIIAYTIASDEVLDLVAYKGSDNVPHVLKRSGAGLIVAYIILALTLLAIVYTEISKIIRKI